MLAIRKANINDLEAVAALYYYLKGAPVAPNISAWQAIIKDEKTHVLLGYEEDKLVSSVTTSIIANLTHDARPYALIENVVTHEDYRARGHASALLGHAKVLAQQENCYKIMLLTGSKQPSTLNFYRRAGYNSEDKTAFIQWL